MLEGACVHGWPGLFEAVNLLVIGVWRRHEAGSTLAAHSDADDEDNESVYSSCAEKVDLFVSGEEPPDKFGGGPVLLHAATHPHPATCSRAICTDLEQPSSSCRMHAAAA